MVYLYSTELQQNAYAILNLLVDSRVSSGTSLDSSSESSSTRPPSRSCLGSDLVTLMRSLVDDAGDLASVCGTSPSGNGSLLSFSSSSGGSDSDSSGKTNKRRASIPSSCALSSITESVCGPSLCLLDLSGDVFQHVLSYLPRAAQGTVERTSRRLNKQVEVYAYKRVLGPLGMRMGGVSWTRMMDVCEFVAKRSTWSHVILNRVGGRMGHSICLDVGGHVWSWGRNWNGQLGDGTKDTQNYPVCIRGVEDAVSVAAGDYHSMALLCNGRVMAWGYNHGGRLGLGHTTDQCIPRMIPYLTKVVSISCGDVHSMALTADGTLWTWGDSDNGRLGQGEDQKDSCLAPRIVEGISDVVQISAGDSHNLVLTSTQQVWSWGFGGHGQLGHGDTNDRWIPVVLESIEDVSFVSAGGEHSLACTSDGHVWAWGSNEYGQCGNTEHTVHPSIPALVENIADVVQVAAGYLHSLAITSEGMLWSWGSNVDSELGLGDSIDRSAPTQIETVDDIAHISGGTTHSIMMA